MSFAAYSVEAFAYECAPDPFIIQVNKLMKKMIKSSFDEKNECAPDPFIIQVILTQPRNSHL